MTKYEVSIQNVKLISSMIVDLDTRELVGDCVVLLEELVERDKPKKVYKEQMLDTYDIDNGCKDFEYENVKCNSCNALLTTENDRYDCWINPTKLNELKFCPNCGQRLDWGDD